MDRRKKGGRKKKKKRGKKRPFPCSISHQIRDKSTSKSAAGPAQIPSRFCRSPSPSPGILCQRGAVKLRTSLAAGYPGRRAAAPPDGGAPGRLPPRGGQPGTRGPAAAFSPVPPPQRGEPARPEGRPFGVGGGRGTSPPLRSLAPSWALSHPPPPPARTPLAKSFQDMSLNSRGLLLKACGEPEAPPAPGGNGSKANTRPRRGPPARRHPARVGAETRGGPSVLASRPELQNLQVHHCPAAAKGPARAAREMHA